MKQKREPTPPANTDEVLRRMLGTPPEPHPKPKQKKPKKRPQ